MERKYSPSTLADKELIWITYKELLQINKASSIKHFKGISNLNLLQAF